MVPKFLIRLYNFHDLLSGELSACFIIRYCDLISYLSIYQFVGILHSFSQTLLPFSLFLNPSFTHYFIVYHQTVIQDLPYLLGPVGEPTA